MQTHASFIKHLWTEGNWPVIDAGSMPVNIIYLRPLGILAQPQLYIYTPNKLHFGGFSIVFHNHT